MQDYIKNKAWVPWVLLIVRVYVGFVWLLAGWGKLTNQKWVGSEAGVAITGFLKGALSKTTGDHPDVQSWYAWLITHIALPNAEIFSYLVTFGELFVGLFLILGSLTVLATSTGLFMNFNFLLAGAVSINPILILLQLLLIWGGEQSSKIGLDKYLRKYFHKNTGI